MEGDPAAAATGAVYPTSAPVSILKNAKKKNRRSKKKKSGAAAGDLQQSSIPKISARPAAAVSFAVTVPPIQELDPVIRVTQARLESLFASVARSTFQRLTKTVSDTASASSSAATTSQASSRASTRGKLVTSTRGRIEPGFANDTNDGCVTNAVIVALREVIPQAPIDHLKQLRRDIIALPWQERNTVSKNMALAVARSAGIRRALEMPVTTTLTTALLDAVKHSVEHWTVIPNAIPASLATRVVHRESVQQLVTYPHFPAPMPFSFDGVSAPQQALYSAAFLHRGQPMCYIVHHYHLTEGQERVPHPRRIILDSRPVYVTGTPYRMAAAIAQGPTDRDHFVTIVARGGSMFLVDGDAAPKRLARSALLTFEPFVVAVFLTPAEIIPPRPDAEKTSPSPLPPTGAPRPEEAAPDEVLAPTTPASPQPAATAAALTSHHQQDFPWQFTPPSLHASFVFWQRGATVSYGRIVQQMADSPGEADAWQLAPPSLERPDVDGPSSNDAESTGLCASSASAMALLARGEDTRAPAGAEIVRGGGRSVRTPAEHGFVCEQRVSHGVAGSRRGHTRAPAGAEIVRGGGRSVRTPAEHGFVCEQRVSHGVAGSRSGHTRAPAGAKVVRGARLHVAAVSLKSGGRSVRTPAEHGCACLLTHLPNMIASRT